MIAQSVANILDRHVIPSREKPDSWTVAADAQSLLISLAAKDEGIGHSFRDLV